MTVKVSGNGVDGGIVDRKMRGWTERKGKRREGMRAGRGEGRARTLKM